MRKSTWLVVAALALLGCDDESAAGADGAVGVDGGEVDGAAPDVGVDRGLDAGADAGADVMPDAMPDVVLDAVPDAMLDVSPDVVPDAAPRDPVATRALPLAEAVVEGPHTALEGEVLLDPGGSLRWVVDDPGQLAEAPGLDLVVAAELWRVEDGAFEVEWNGARAAVEVRGDADGAPARARVPYAAWAAPVFGPGALPPPVELATDGAGPWSLVLRATGGSVRVRGVWLVDPLGALPEARPAPGRPEAVTVLEPLPCAVDDVECDDGARLSAAIADAPPGPVTVRLQAGVYTLRTTLRVARDDVWVEGAGDESAAAGTVLRWDPTGRGPAIRFGGAGLDNGAAAAVEGPIEGASRRYRVAVGEEWAPEWLWVTADDFGEVPPVCVEGRDVERYARHIGRMVRVLGIERDDAGAVVEVDRPLNLDIPAEASPRLVPARVTRGGGVTSLHLEGNCPEALAISNFTEAACSNPGVIDDDGLMFDWAAEARAEAVSAQGLGKFSIMVQRSVEVRVVGCSMHHPAAYGGGGQGYGVHLIRTGRTVVRGERVEVARHGVVVDFGSTDAQVLDGYFRTMNQALIDVHGEASYDTLIRGNDLADASLGVIVGGGGRETHCNDGPRHHVEHNVIDDAGLAAVSVSDYTGQVWVRSNRLEGSATGLTVAFGAHDVLAEHNVFGPMRVALPPVTTINEDTAGVVARRNLFEAACDAAAAGRAQLGAEAPVLEDNVYCLGE